MYIPARFSHTGTVAPIIKHISLKSTMHQSNLPRLKELFDQFRQDAFYVNREQQLSVTPIIKDIIQATLRSGPLLNEHLTGFIQMFKSDAKNEGFGRYLQQNVPDEPARQQLAERFVKEGKNGFTGAGLRSINGLSQQQLDSIKQFLQDAFQIGTTDQAVNLCTAFDEQGISYVKRGIYSPWLYYINPGIFPIINNSHTVFLRWMGIPDQYPACIAAFNQLKQYLEVKDMGLLDAFAHKFSGDKIDGTPVTLDVSGHRVFKMSHGILLKASGFKKNEVLKIVEENNWIALDRYTGRKQAQAFAETARPGDIVYVCYGGDALYCIGRIISDAKPFDEVMAKKMEGDEWIYREIEPLHYPVDSNMRDLKDYKTNNMPSGYSTFREIPPTSLPEMNEKLFIPKFNVRMISSNIPASSDTGDQDPKTEKISPSRNIILYGPPGTGKTYNSIFQAVAVIEQRDLKSLQDEGFESVKRRFDSYRKEGRIAFTSFHQSMSYEDFIEGIKPLPPDNEGEPVQYEVVDGIFKALCTEAGFSIVSSLNTKKNSDLKSFEDKYNSYVDKVSGDLLEGKDVELLSKKGGRILINSITNHGNIQVKHKESDRTYTVSKVRLMKLDAAFPKLKEVGNINERFRSEIGGHNSSAYWAVLNAIREMDPADVTASNGAFSDEAKKEVVEQADVEMFTEGGHSPYVIIIDEINRGNIAQIFGELITLLEEDKRLGETAALTVTLPYSKKRFGVPPNVFVIGTMNTADRSVEALDTALRRRFSFVPHLPDATTLGTTTDNINLQALLEAINARLRILKDSEHTIGHAWLWDTNDLEDLKTAFSNKILPLLQEYFFNDYEKLGLVLGDAFFSRKAQISRNVFAKFTGGNEVAYDYENTWEYELKPVNQLTGDDFRSLYAQNGVK